MEYLIGLCVGLAVTLILVVRGNIKLANKVEELYERLSSDGRP